MMIATMKSLCICWTEQSAGAISIPVSSLPTTLLGPVPINHIKPAWLVVAHQIVHCSAICICSLPSRTNTLARKARCPAHCHMQHDQQYPEQHARSKVYVQCTQALQTLRMIMKGHLPPIREEKCHRQAWPLWAAPISQI